MSYIKIKPIRFQQNLANIHHRLPITPICLIMKVNEQQLTTQAATSLLSKYFNPDWNRAQIHGRASRIGIPQPNTPMDFCDCCFHHINKSQIPLSEDTKELEFLGFGFPLYFSFVRNCIFLLLVMICCYNLPSLYYALIHNQQFCHRNLDHLTPAPTPHPEPQILPSELKHFRIHTTEISNDHSPTPTTPEQTSEQEAVHEIECTGWMIYLSRIQKQVSIEEQLFRCGSFFIHLMLLLYIRERLTKMKYYFDQRSASPSDFAVFVKNIPARPVGQKQQLLRVLNWQYGNVNPMEIILIPDLKVYETLGKDKRQLFHQLQKLIAKPKQMSMNKVHEIIGQIQSKQAQQKKFIRRDKQKERKDELQAQRAILIFNTQDQKWDLINAHQTKPISTEGWTRLSITEAAEPQQVLWQNSCYNNKDKRYFKMLEWVLSILTLVAITSIFGIISHFKSKLVEDKIIEYQKSTDRNPHLLRQAFFLVMGMIFFVVLFNKFVLAHLFHKFTELGKHSSTYKFQFYFCLKYCLGLFFTTALMTLIIEDFIFRNFFKHNFGVIEEETIMFLFNSTFVPLFWLINPMYLLKKFKRWRNFHKAHLLQKQAHELMENPQYDVGKRYGQVLEIMWFTFLYMTLIPVGCVFSVIGLITYYWVDKYNLLRKSAIVSQVSGDLINLTLTMLEITLILRVLGEILFDYQLRDQIPLVSWAYLIVAVLYNMLPGELLVNLVNGERFFYQKMSYKEAQVFFNNTYQDVHILYNRLDEDHEAIKKKKAEKKQYRNQNRLQNLKNQTLPQKRQQARIVTNA